MFQRVLGSAALVVLASVPASAEWKRVAGRIETRWAAGVTPETAHREYPRPQMRRDAWLGLNGLWDYAILPKDASRPDEFDGKILVPYPVESALSGVGRTVGPESTLWYRRTFEIPPAWEGQRILLHLGAVDWEASIEVNGRRVGFHRGGYDPIVVDVTEALRDDPAQELVVAVHDPTDAGFQPRGKQVRRPEGIWYTSVTGIWQSVWLEPVPASSIGSLVIVPDVPGGRVRVTARADGAPVGSEVRVRVRAGDRVLSEGAGKPGEEISIALADARLWSPEDPFLHDLDVELRSGESVDRVKSYFGMRDISLGRDGDGVTRMLLNGKPTFQYGPLDQGWWPDGLYTAPGDEALRYDIEETKRLGCNMLRKHVKVEPDRFYYWCDRLGILVWQDMPNGNNGGEEGRQSFREEWKRVIDALRNHPSIIVWVPFNEGWGQHETARVVQWTKAYDPSRLVNEASGWHDRGSGDLKDVHRYPGPGAPKLEERRAAVLGEFGGLGLPVAGHLWRESRNWGYRSYETREALTDAYVELLDRLRWLIGEGLCAAVYTQTTDVEIEVNGLITYDRAVVKMDPARARAAALKLYQSPPRVERIVPTSREEGRVWRFTQNRPGAGWASPAYDDSEWAEGRGGFGTEGTPGAVVRTEWKSGEIWLRRTIELDRKPSGKVYLSVHHDEDAEVWINGKLVRALKGYTTSYVIVPISTSGDDALREGKNTIAVHCRQTTGGQYIDVGLVQVSERT